MVNEEITPELSQLILDLLEKTLADGKRRALPMPKIFASLEKEIKAIYPDIDRYRFQKVLSKYVREDGLPGYEVKLGKAGGIGKKEEPKPVSKLISKEMEITEETLCELDFSGKHYKISLPKAKIEKLLTKVFRAQESLCESGDLYFDDRTFCIDPESYQYVDNFLFYFDESGAE